MKKILQIKKGEYLLDVMTNKGVINSIKTTYNKDVALDIQSWSLEQLGFIVGNLEKVGYNKCSVVVIEDKPVVEEVVEDEA